MREHGPVNDIQGNLCADFRLVRRYEDIARLKIFDQWWYSLELVAFIGQRVWVEAACPWWTEITVMPYRYDSEGQFSIIDRDAKATPASCRTHTILGKSW